MSYNLPLLLQYIFKVGACYGLFRHGDMMLQGVGIILAIGFGFEIVCELKKMDRLTK